MPNPGLFTQDAGYGTDNSVLEGGGFWAEPGGRSRSPMPTWGRQREGVKVGLRV